MALPLNYTLIETKTVASATSSVSFTSIPQTYTDLKLVVSDRGSRAAFYSNNRLKINNDSSALYDWRWVRGYNGAVSSPSATNDDGISWYPTGSSGDADTFSNTEIYISNYTSSNYKVVSIETSLSQNSNVNYFDICGIYMYKSSSAVTSLVIDGSPNAYTISAGSTFSLYGISNASKVYTPKATGGVISTDGTYIIHTFTATGTFTPSQALTCDYMVVAGGAGGGGGGDGGWPGGGGGAGGYRYITGASFASGVSYTATIGGGGSGGGQNSYGSNGSNSSLIGGAISTSATGGGGGGYGTNSVGSGGTNGLSGGSGGGGASNYTGSTTGGSGNAGGYTPVEGYAGGKGQHQPPGAGGSASRTGGNSYDGTIGVTNSITGYPAEYARGGGAGRGDSVTTYYFNQPANTGNGGCSSIDGSNRSGKNGGSGIVIVRYLI